MRPRARLLPASLVAPGCALLLTGCFTAPPQIIQLNPVNGSTGVAADAPIRVVFDHAVRRDSVAPRLHVDPSISGCDVAAAFHPRPADRCRVSWSPDSTSFTLLHAEAPFAPDTRYSFSLSPGVTDQQGVVNSLDHRWAITSGPPPVVNGINPSNGSTAVPVDTPLVIAFSNAMESRTAAAITLSPPVPGTRVVRNTRDHGRFVVLPGRLLDAGATYTITIGTGAIDEHGQHLAVPQRSVFQTGGLARQGHAIVLARRSGEEPSEVLLTALGAQAQGEPAASAVVVEAPRCVLPPCGAVGVVGAPLVAYLQAAVSPDGNWVALVQRDLQLSTGRSEVLLVALPSLAARVVAADGSLVSWSPDSQRLAYAAPDGVHVDGVAIRLSVVLPPGDPLDAPAAWSGDSRQLALPVRQVLTGRAHVDLADPDLRVRYPVPGLGVGDVSSPALSPDGSVLVVRRDGGSDLDGTWTLRLRSGDPTPRRLGSDLTPIAFVDPGTLLAVERPPDGDSGLVRVSVNSGDRDRLRTQPQDSDLSTAVAAPSGRQVAYLLPDAAGVRQAEIVNLDGSNPAPLTTFPRDSLEAVAVSFAG